MYSVSNILHMNKIILERIFFIWLNRYIGKKNYMWLNCGMFMLFCMWIIFIHGTYTMEPVIRNHGTEGRKLCALRNSLTLRNRSPPLWCATEAERRRVTCAEWLTIFPRASWIWKLLASMRARKTPMEAPWWLQTESWKRELLFSRASTEERNGRGHVRNVSPILLGRIFTCD